MKTGFYIVMIPIILPSVVIGSLMAVIYKALVLGFIETKEYLES